MNGDSFIGVIDGVASKKSRDKNEAILEAAVSVIGEYGYHNAPISRIAREAGVADGTVYLYFKNKEDLLISILRQTIGKIVEIIETRWANVHSPRERLQILVESYFDELSKNPNLARVTQVHLRQSDTDMRRQIGEIIRPYYYLIDTVIDQGIEQGIFRNIDKRISRRMIFGTMDETITAWILTGAKYNLVSLVPPVVDIMSGGLLNTQSHKN